MHLKPLALVMAAATLSISTLTTAENIPAQEEKAATAVGILANQVGFLPSQFKAAVVPNLPTNEFKLTDKSSGKVVYNGVLSKPKVWSEAQETVKIADFSGFNYSGKYQLTVEGVDAPFEVNIGSNIYQDALAGAIKSYYYNRNSAALEERHAGVFQRPASHPDTIVYVHASAATNERPEGTIISSPKGWFDAGDYGKYIVNSNITTYTLLRALENNPDLFMRLELNIPESNDPLPDLLNEILWNLDWMETMQDADGGLYHKLTTKRFEDLAMPHEEYKPRFVVQKTTAATLGFAAVFARASQIVAHYEDQLPGRAERYQNAAIRAWDWAKKNPKVTYVQPEDFQTGMYGSKPEHLMDEWAWAAAEIFQLTGKKKYLKTFELPEKVRTPEWSSVELLALTSLVRNPKTPKKLKVTIIEQLKTTADAWVVESQESGYGVALFGKDFRWGSNGYAANKALALFEINQIAPNPDYVKSAQALLDYLFGRNPNNISYLTGFGANAAKAPHHRISAADKIDAPVPGMLVGGPHQGYQDEASCVHDKVTYDISIPAKAYNDHWCSYATNEIAINWNAGLVYILAEMNR